MIAPLVLYSAILFSSDLSLYNLVMFSFDLFVARAILGDPGAVNGGARKINRRDERFHESLQGGVTPPCKLS